MQSSQDLSWKFDLESLYTKIEEKLSYVLRNIPLRPHRNCIKIKVILHYLIFYLFFYYYYFFISDTSVKSTIHSTVVHRIIHVLGIGKSPNYSRTLFWETLWHHILNQRDSAYCKLIQFYRDFSSSTFLNETQIY